MGKSGDHRGARGTRHLASAGSLVAGGLLGWFAHTWFDATRGDAGEGGAGAARDRPAAAPGGSLLRGADGRHGGAGGSAGWDALPDAVEFGSEVPAADRFKAITEGMPGANHLAALQSLAAEAPLDELPGLYDRVWNWTGTPDFAGPLLEVWARRDPRGAVDHLGRDARGSGYRERLGRVHAVWALSDRDAALGSALELDRPLDRKTAIEHILSGLAGSDGPGALALYERVPRGLVDEGWFFDNVYGKWAHDDPAGAAERAGALGFAERRNRALDGVAWGWAEQDPQAALAWAGTFEAVERDRLVRRVLARWTADDPFAAWDQLDHHLSREVARSFRSDAIEAMIRRDPVAAIERIEALPAEERGIDLLRPVAGELAAVDPGSAVAFYEAHRGALGDQAYDLVDSIARQWAQSDPAEAFEWLDSFAPDHRVHAAMVAAAEQWGRRDPRGAFARLEGLEDGPESASLVGPLFEAWARQDPLAAVEAAAALDDPSVAARGLRAAVSSWAEVDPERALEFAVDLPGSGESGVDAAELLNQLARERPDVAAGWISRHDGLEPDPATVGRVSGPWMDVDPAGFERWVERLAPGRARDTGIANLVNRMAGSDPEGARRWIPEFSTAELQETWRRRLDGGSGQ